MIGLLIVIGLIPLYVWIGRIDEHTDRTHVEPFGYICGAFAGWVVGVVVTLFSAQYLLSAAGRIASLPEEVYVLGWVAFGLLGGFVGGGVSYVVLRVHTARDPDYEDDPGAGHRPVPADPDTKGA